MKEVRVFNPKITLNFQYRVLEKNLKANIKTNRFFFKSASTTLSPLLSTKKATQQPNDHFSWPNLPIFVIYNWNQAAFSWPQRTESLGL